MQIKYVRESSVEFQMKALSACKLLINPTWWNPLSNNVDDDGGKSKACMQFDFINLICLKTDFSWLREESFQGSYWNDKHATWIGLCPWSMCSD